MNAIEFQQRINELQQQRHMLLARREQRGTATATIDMALNVVRSELQAIYALQRDQKPANNQRIPATHGLKMA